MERRKREKGVEEKGGRGEEVKQQRKQERRERIR